MPPVGSELLLLRIAAHPDTPMILPPTPAEKEIFPMTTRYRNRLASLVVASACVLATTGTASAFELLLLNRGVACGCDTCSTKSGGKGDSCQSCCAATPVLDRMAEMTRSMKCRLQTLPRLELPTICLPCIDLSLLFPCNSCCECGHGKSAGKAVSANSAQSPVYNASDVPVEAPPVPITHDRGA